MRDRGVRAHRSCEAGLRHCCVCVFYCACVIDYALIVRGRNTRNVYLLRDWEQVCTLRLTRVCVYCMTRTCCVSTHIVV